MKIEIKKFNSVLNVTDVFLNSKLVGVIGISGGFTYLKSAKISVEEDNAITDALKIHNKPLNCIVNHN
jgi:glutamate formiminotransferase